MTEQEKYLEMLNESLKQRSMRLPVLKRMVARMRRSAAKKNAPPWLQQERFNLKVFETQLKTIESSLENDELTLNSFDQLPLHKQKQILTRLENIKARALKHADTASEKGEKFESQPFQCFSDFDKCMKLKSTNVYWCHFAFYVCVLRSIVPFMK